MNTQTQTTKKNAVKTLALTAAGAVATLGVLATTVKPSLADEYVPGQYALYGQWIPAHVNVGPVPHYWTPRGEYYMGHYAAGGQWIPPHYA